MAGAEPGEVTCIAAAAPRQFQSMAAAAMLAAFTDSPDTTAAYAELGGKDSLWLRARRGWHSRSLRRCLRWRWRRSAPRPERRNGGPLKRGGSPAAAHLEARSRHFGVCWGLGRPRLGSTMGSWNTPTRTFL